MIGAIPAPWRHQRRAAPVSAAARAAAAASTITTLRLRCCPWRFRLCWLSSSWANPKHAARFAGREMIRVMTARYSEPAGRTVS